MKKMGSRNIRKTKKKTAARAKKQNRMAMLGITFVVGVLFIGMMTKGMELQEQLSSYNSKLEKLDEQLEEETQRTQEIDDLKDYMKTDEYAEQVAREKLGLVKGNEIIFKAEE
ncbi:MAG: septum formation initiator family protein [Blautia sp.]|nr:septum formation initiator family protein [Blautia sp.]